MDWLVIQDQKIREMKKNISTTTTSGITRFSPPIALFSHNLTDIVFGLYAIITFAPNSPMALIHANTSPAAISLEARGKEIFKNVMAIPLPRVREAYS